MSTPLAEHWQSAYAKPDDALSWTRAHLDTSLALLRAHGFAPGLRVVDIGAGRSSLVDDLLDAGLSRITLVDLSQAALDAVRERLGARAASVRFLAGDLRTLPLPAAGFDRWHDRAVAHFLTTPEDEAAYGTQVRHAVAPGGIVVIGGFAPDGPERCSGLPVQRRDAALMHDLVGREAFDCLDEVFEEHVTPAGRVQRFCFGVFRKR